MSSCANSQKRRLAQSDRAKAVAFTSLFNSGIRFDGGAMFGNAPKALWQRWVTPDDRNRISLATRSLLVECRKHKILIDAGVGAYMSKVDRDRYGVKIRKNPLTGALHRLGVSQQEVTDIILSHLHFDHVGGVVSTLQEGQMPILNFPHARFYVSEKAWTRSASPHPRDRVSFIPQFAQALEASGRLIKLTRTETLSFPELKVKLRQSQGHTPGMLYPDIQWQGKRLVCGTDLIPGVPWLNLAISTGYDRFPEQLLHEKQMLLHSICRSNAWLFFYHDTKTALCKIERDAKGKGYTDTKRLSRMMRACL